MPRSGWIALGAVVAAVVLPATPAGSALAAMTVLATGAIAAWAVAVRVGGRSDTVRTDPLARRAKALAASALGAWAVAARLLLLGGDGAIASAPLPDGAGPWRAVVESVSAPHDGRQPAMLVLDRPAGFRVAAMLPRYPTVEPGTEVVVTGRLEPLPDSPYGGHLARIGVRATLLSRLLELPASGESTSPLERLRRGSAEALSRALPEPEAGLAAGILIGLRDRVDRDLASAFTTAGVSHVVAISGWNISIVGGLVATFAGRLRRRRRAALVLLAVAAYVVFAGASPSVVRAGAMAAVVLVARETGRAGLAATALGWSATLMLLADPAVAGDPGFQLSTIATAGLVALGTRWARRLHDVTRGHAPAWLTESLAVSLAAQAVTLPIVLLDFGRISLVAPLVNLLVAPLVAPAMAGGGLALAGGWLTIVGAPELVATIGGLPGWLALGALVTIVRTAATVPFAAVGLDPPANLLTGAIAAVALLLLATPVGRTLGVAWRAGHRRSGRRPFRFGTGPPRRDGPRRRRPERWIAALLAASLVAFVFAAASRPDGRLRVSVLDVGQGDAILVEGDRGGRLLVDGGPDPDRLLLALDGRLPPWDRRIDVVVLTHPHEDHVAGLPLLLERYRVGSIYEPGMRGPGPGYAAYAAWLRAAGRASGRLATGDRLTLDSLSLRVLWPDPGSVPVEPPDTGTAINNVSIVLLGTYGRQRILLAGDIEQGVDPVLLERRLPRVDVLKVAHHGSRTASTDAILAALRPAVAIVSVGTGNSYGHPAPATIRRLRAHGAIVFRTDLDGTVQVVLDGTHLVTSPARPIASDHAAGAATSLLYHRLDADPVARGRRLAPPVPGPADLAPPSLPGGRRNRGLARPARDGHRRLGRPDARGGRGPAPRRGQVVARGRPVGRAPPRRRLGRLADPARPP